MNKRNLLYATAPVIFALAAACSSARGDERGADGRPTGSADEVTVAGCLSTDANGRYALTAAPDAGVAVTARAMTDDRDTHSYVLVGGDNLASHVGKRVEVTGTVSGKRLDMEHKDTRTQQEPPASGGDRNQPSVKTREEIDLEARQLTVREVRDVAPTCVVNP